MGTGGNQVPLILRVAGFKPRNSAKAYGIGYMEEQSPTLSTAKNEAIVILGCPIPINDKATRYQGGGKDRNNDGGGNGLGIGKAGDPMPTLTANDRHDVKSKDSDNTILSKLFPGGRLIMCGANSPTGLASRPIRILLCDEVDRFCKSAGTEGDPVALASKRTTTFWNYCVGLFSTPTLVGTSRIEAEYNSGTMEEWQHECPNCHEFSLIKYANLQIDYEESKKNDGSRLITIKSILYHCPHCGFGYDEQTMLNDRRTEWMCAKLLVTGSVPIKGYTDDGETFIEDTMLKRLF